MQKITQNVTDLLEKLSNLETDWKDNFALKVMSILSNIPDDTQIEESLLIYLLDTDFEVGSTIFRLFLEMSKDEYTTILKDIFGGTGLSGKKGYLKDKKAYIKKLDHFLIKEKIKNTINKKYSWKDIIVERLKAGRGSAIKGQKRGRDLENFVEDIIKQVFTKYDPRCSFTGMNGLSSEKADFAIPSKESPEIIIEVKGYGATGSKQTDVIGDINRIIQEKRHDTIFLLFTDGITWKSRESDFRKLIKYQNEGYIYRIYTKSLAPEFLQDLIALKQEKNL